MLKISKRKGENCGKQGRKNNNASSLMVFYFI